MLNIVGAVAVFALFFGAGYLWLLWYGKKPAGPPLWQPVVVTVVLASAVVALAVAGTQRDSRDKDVMLDRAEAIVLSEHPDSRGLTDRFRPELQRKRWGTLEVEYRPGGTAVITVISRPTEDQYRKTSVLGERVVDLPG